ncbi:MAG: response regulator transcription factor [Flavobacteriales bacterium]|nr:response regulator transcription factor [Flavobacteriales bacterium]
MSERTYTAVVIDDEAKQRAVIRKILEDRHPEIRIVGEAADARTGRTLIQESSPEIIFLDIRMPRGSGLDMLKKLNDVRSEVIFITGYDQFALQALKLSAVDYLLKPLMEDELAAAITKATDRIHGKRKQQDYDLLQHNLDNAEDQRSMIHLPGVDDLDLVQVGDIIRFEGEQRYTRVYLKGGQDILSSYNIGVFEDLLHAYDFIKTHKSHLINAQHVKALLQDGLLLLSDDSQVPVSRRRREEVKSWLTRSHSTG